MKQEKPLVGLHLRLTNTLTELVERAAQMQIPLYQCFLVTQDTHQLIALQPEDCASYVQHSKKFVARYLHASYWINLSKVKQTRHRVFYRELELAKKLNFTHMILHPGSATGGRTKDDGIDALARALNEAIPQAGDVTLVLENTCHSRLSVGGDLHDFRKILEKLDKPEKLAFCIDTAHAYSYGYDVAQEQGQNEFIDLLEQTIGIDRIVLLHLNDTTEKLGSKIDRHAVPGEGNIGLDPLRRFATDARLRHIPVLLELPVVSAEKEQEILNLVRSWK